MKTTIFVLGGYGGTGREVCRKLLETTTSPLIIAGRDLDKARTLSAGFVLEFPKRKISAVYADASKYESLLKAFGGVTLIIDATTATGDVLNVARAAIEVGADYLDFHFEQNVVVKLESIRKEIEQSNRCFITQAGFHPGLPAALVRYASIQFGEMTKANIGMCMNTKIEKPESIYELVDMLSDYKVDIFKKGIWKRAGWADFASFNFGEDFGWKTCYPIQMAEMLILPKMFPQLKETGVYVAGFNWFIDYFVFPFAFLLCAIKKGFGRRLLARLLTFGFNKIPSRGKGVSFVLEASGAKAGKSANFRILLHHDDAYAFTAIPVVILVRQYLDGTIKQPGLWLMGHIVEPRRLLKDMAAMGVIVHTNE